MNKIIVNDTFLINLLTFLLKYFNQNIKNYYEPTQNNG